MTKHEPYKIKAIRHIKFNSLTDRKKLLRNVNYNTGLLSSDDVTFDMVTQGTSAASQEQMANLFIGDEAYAGARNFYKLSDSINKVFGKELVCPIHNCFGGIKLLCSVFVSKGKYIPGNTALKCEVINSFGGKYYHLSSAGDPVFPGNINTDKFEKFLEQNNDNVSFVYIDLQGGGDRPISLDNLLEIQRIVAKFNAKLVLNTSCIVEAANYLMNHENSLKDKTIKYIVRAMAACADTIIFDAGQDAMSNVGGFLATNDAVDHEKYINDVVVFEGLHTYGGMAGRTMEVVATGLLEMVDDLHADWTEYQVSVLANILEQGNVPFTRGLNGVYLHPDEFLVNAGAHSAPTLSAALYLISGVRAHLEGLYISNDLLPVLIPRRTLMNTQIEQIAHSIIYLYEQREKIKPLILIDEPEYHFEAHFDWLVPNLEPFIYSCEPYIINVIEHVGMKNREERFDAVIEAGYNTFLLKSEDVTIDFLTDSGTSAMSVEQWNAYLGAKETPATPEAYYDIVKTAQKIYGYKYVILTHQGRAAEHIMSQMFIKPGNYVPGNMYFTTTKLHQEIAGGKFVDVIIDEAHDTTSEFPWKGNIDLDKLKAVYDKATSEGKEVSYVSFEFNVNMAGGQPVSMDNIKAVYEFCRPKGIPVFFDATRCSENACFIQRKDPNYADVPVADILLEMFSYGDGATISSKKDMLTNLSGNLLFKDNEAWYKQAQRMLQLYEGTYCSGGTSAGDMAAHAQGLREMVDDLYINSRIDQTHYLGKLLTDAGIPIVLPPGGHAIFLDARAFLPHIDQDQYPSQMLAAQIFIETGVRPMERGNVSKGRNPETGDNYRPALELVRLTIPRRVYSNDHMKAVADGIIRLYEKRHTIKGLKFTYEPEKLRFFQGRFEEV